MVGPRLEGLTKHPFSLTSAPGALRQGHLPGPTQIRRKKDASPQENQGFPHKTLLRGRRKGLQAGRNDKYTRDWTRGCPTWPWMNALDWRSGWIQAFIASASSFFSSVPMRIILPKVIIVARQGWQLWATTSQGQHEEAAGHRPFLGSHHHRDTFVWTLKIFIYLAAPELKVLHVGSVPWPGTEPRPPALGAWSVVLDTGGHNSGFKAGIR